VDTFGRQVPAALAAEHRKGGGDAVQDAPQVDVNDRRPAGCVEVADRPDLADAGVAD
jgi:hypothetical protein